MPHIERRSPSPEAVTPPSGQTVVPFDGEQYRRADERHRLDLAADRPGRAEGQQPFGGGLNAPEPGPPRGPKDGPVLEPAAGPSTDAGPAGARGRLVWNLVLQEMRQRRLTLAQVACQTGVSSQTLRNYRDGKTKRLDGDVLDRLCAHFDWGEPDAVLRWGMAKQQQNEESDRALARWLLSRGEQPEDLDDPSEPQHLRELNARLKELMAQELARQRTAAAPERSSPVVVWGQPGEDEPADPGP